MAIDMLESDEQWVTTFGEPEYGNFLGIHIANHKHTSAPGPVYVFEDGSNLPEALTTVGTWDANIRKVVRDNATKNLDPKYPFSSDCTVLDKSISDATSALSQIQINKDGAADPRKKVEWDEIANITNDRLQALKLQYNAGNCFVKTQDALNAEAQKKIDAALNAPSANLFDSPAVKYTAYGLGGLLVLVILVKLFK